MEWNIRNNENVNWDWDGLIEKKEENNRPVKSEFPPVKRLSHISAGNDNSFFHFQYTKKDVKEDPPALPPPKPSEKIIPLYDPPEEFSPKTMIPPPKTLLYERLSPEQKTVVFAPPCANVLVRAGPGSGKTTTITARILYLLLQRCFPILCFTFTRKAANEMRTRIHKEVLSLLSSLSHSTQDPPCDQSNLKDLLESLFRLKDNGVFDESKIFIGTIHSFCRFFLKKNAGRFGIPSSFVLLGPGEQKALIVKLLKENPLSSSSAQGSSLQREAHTTLEAGVQEDGSYAALPESEAEKQLLREVEEMKSAIRRWKYSSKYGEYMKKKEPERAALIEKYFMMCQRCDTALLMYLRQAGGSQYQNFHAPSKFYTLYDFTDLILETRRLLQEHETLRQEVTQAYPFIFCDELQDTNQTQMHILSLLQYISGYGQFFGGVTGVGDGHQSIFSFRGTDATIFERFKALFFNQKRIPTYDISLNNNWRCKLPIQFAANRVISFNNTSPQQSHKSQQLLIEIQKQIDLTLSTSELSGGPTVGPTTRPADGPGKNDIIPMEKLLKGLQEGLAHSTLVKTSYDEVKFICDTILRLKNESLTFTFSDFCVLARLRSSVKEFLQTANKYLASIDVKPFFDVEIEEADITSAEKRADSTAETRVENAEKTQGVNWAKAKDVQLLLSYLRFFINPDDDKNIKKIINNPKRGIGESLVKALMGDSEESETPKKKKVKEEVPAFMKLNSKLFNTAKTDGGTEGNDTGEETLLSIDTSKIFHMSREQFFDASYSASKHILAVRPKLCLREREIGETAKREDDTNSFSIWRRLLHEEQQILEQESEQTRAKTGKKRNSSKAESSKFTPSQIKNLMSFIKLVRACYDDIFDDCVAVLDVSEVLHRIIKNLNAFSPNTFAVSSPTSPSTFIGDCLSLASHYSYKSPFSSLPETFSSEPPQASNGQSPMKKSLLIKLMYDFLYDIHLLSKNLKSRNKITVSTIHQAKGREWSVVFLPFCQEGVIPLFPKTGKGQDDSKKGGVGEIGEGDTTIEEERRIFYVAVTRAKSLFLASNSLVSSGTGDVYQPSRFLLESALAHPIAPVLQFSAAPSAFEREGGGFGW